MQVVRLERHNQSSIEALFQKALTQHSITHYALHIFTLSIVSLIVVSATQIWKALSNIYRSCFNIKDSKEGKRLRIIIVWQIEETMKKAGKKLRVRKG